jgi:hypothetical protein
MSNKVGSSITGHRTGHRRALFFGRRFAFDL